MCVLGTSTRKGNYTEILLHIFILLVLPILKSTPKKNNSFSYGHTCIFKLTFHDI